MRPREQRGIVSSDRPVLFPQPEKGDLTHPVVVVAAAAFVTLHHTHLEVLPALLAHGLGSGLVVGVRDHFLSRTPDHGSLFTGGVHRGVTHRAPWVRTTVVAAAPQPGGWLRVERNPFGAPTASDFHQARFRLCARLNVDKLVSKDMILVKFLFFSLYSR